MIIDEWDAPIREAKNQPEIQRAYLEFLRSLFKNSGITDKIFVAVYMTGILPVKKDGSQSAISDFREFSMIFPSEFAKTIREVRRDETIRRVRESDQLIYDTVHRNVDAVAAQIEKIHALLIEMKWNKSTKGAIAQIKEKHNPDAIKEYGGDVLLVGINYDKNAPAGKRKHECVIENIKDI